jgi:hypothetical protein
MMFDQSSQFQRGRDTTPWITHRSAAAQLVGMLPAWLVPDAGLIKAFLEF